MKEKYSTFLLGLKDLRDNKGYSEEQVLEHVTKLAGEGHEYARRALEVWEKDRSQGTSVNSFWTRIGGGATRIEGVHPDAE